MKHRCDEDLCRQVNDEEAVFFCSLDAMFVCNNCFENGHKPHKGVDGIKNHLSSHLSNWQELYHKATELKKDLQENLASQKDMILYLSSNSACNPSINPLRLPRILDIYRKTLSEKIRRVFELCKENNLLGVIEMKAEYRQLNQ